MNKPKRASDRVTDTLLHTKLMPPRLSAGVIRREDLLARLDEGLTRKLTMITAPIGFGKATLVRMWLADRNVSFAWVTLDKHDNDPVRFWTYIVTALRTFDDSLAKSVLAALKTAAPDSLHNILTRLIVNLAKYPKNCLLVLADYQTIFSPEVNRSLSFLLERLPKSLHLILLSHCLPALSLAELRASDELIELDAVTLRFTSAETQAFLREAARSYLSEGAIASLQERTDGWVAGLRLMELSLQNKSGEQVSEIIRAFTGEHHRLADYLTKTVFDNQPREVQDFLLHACFLSSLTGSLCDALTGGSDGTARLEQLERDKLFIIKLEHGAGPAWYRFQTPLIDSLQQLAYQRFGETGVNSLSAKAAAWYESHMPIA
jgi:LuxR family maltose regulon positive regulatory protein